MTRRDWIAMAERNATWAREYHAEGDLESRDGCLTTAAAAYRHAGLDGMAHGLERFIGTVPVEFVTGGLDLEPAPAGLVA